MAHSPITRYVTGGQHPLFCRRPRDGGEKRVLVDGNQMAKPHAYFRIASVAHSSDHSLIAYAVDTKGSEFYTVNVIETDSGAVVDSRIADNRDRSNGRPTAVRFSMFGLMKTTVHAVCCGTQLAPTGPMISSMRRMIPVSFWV